MSLTYISSVQKQAAVDSEIVIRLLFLPPKVKTINSYFDDKQDLP
jgi:hypothetical protein